MGIPISKMVTIGMLPSFLKKFYYRMTGAKIGKNVTIGLFSVISGKSIEIGDRTKIAPLVFISAKKKISLGNRVKIKMLTAIETGEVEIGSDTTINEQVIIGGMMIPSSKITIGKRVRILNQALLNTTESITIGDDTAIGGGTYIFTHATALSIMEGFPVQYAPVTIENNVCVAWSTYIMPGVTIGQYSTITPRSVVYKNVPPRSLVSGNPAKVVVPDGQFIRSLSFERKHKIMLRILRDYKEYMEFIDYTISSREADGVIHLSFSRGRKRFSLVYSKDIGLSPNSAGDIFISLSPIKQELKDSLTKKNKAWFDIEGNVTKFSRILGWEETYAFLSRFGIRGEILD